MNKQSMMVHCGGEVIPMEDLAKYEVPEQTTSYQPVPHFELAEYIRSTSAQLIGQPPIREQYAVAKDGARMFGLQVYGKDMRSCELCNGSGQVTDGEIMDTCPVCSGLGQVPADEYGFGVAFRNSYDKSMSIGIAMGFNVFVCDNLCISGEIKILRKHTKKCWEDVDMHLMHTLVRRRPAMIESFDQDVSKFKHEPLDKRNGYRMLGELMGLEVLMPTQANVAFSEWNHVSQAVDRETNYWHLYNACTVALKNSPPHRVLERHRSLHEVLLGEVG